MCGIVGMTGAGAELALVQRMNDSVRHRGPDGEGLWSVPGVAFGHRRLKIIDLSEAGRQPMTTSDGRYTIVFNGEVYNYIELRRELPDVNWKSKSDTEVILEAYARWGAACLERFIGMYALAIWDAQKRELFCARDRLGIKPLYYAYLDGNLIFASEIHALLGAGVPRALNEGVLYDFLARDFYEHTDETFFEGIHKLPAASWMLVRDGRVETIRSYWNLATEVAKQTISPDRQRREEELLALCASAVDIHLRSDVPVGVALSGGLDSATLLSFLDTIHPDPTRVEAFSFVFAEAAYSERPYIEIMAEKTKRRAHFVEMSARDFAESAEGYAIAQEEPFAGAPISAYSMCLAKARQHDFIVIMDGSGIDESLAGYGRFQPALWADLFKQGRWDDLNAELSANHITTSAQRAHALGQMYGASRPHADVGMGQDLTASVRPDCLNPEFVQAAQQAMPEFDRPFDDNLRNLMYREVRFTKLPRALRFRDRLSMAVGTELRPPFLDHRLMAYAFALPSEDHIYRGTSKVILRRAASRLLPDAVRLASKRSVQTPQTDWFRGELKDWVRERIDTPSFWARGWVDEKRGRAAMERFFKGEGNNSFFLWQWINLEMWYQSFLESSQPVRSS